jgi:hypothetical protein
MEMKPQLPGGLTASQVLDTYFLEARARLIELAAMLDRIDRAAEAAAVRTDSRLKFIQDSLKILQRSEPGRARAIQELYSLK